MPGHPIRPTFAIPLRPGPDEAMEILRERLSKTDYRGCSRSKGRCAYFFVAEEERTVWSPHLSVQVESRNPGSLLRGRFGPHPELWTLFMFLYTAVGFFTTIGLMLGFVQWQSGMDAWGLWGVWLGLPGLAILYAVSAAGQRISAHQMEELRARIEDLVVGLEANPDEGPLHSGIEAPVQSPST